MIILFWGVVILGCHPRIIDRMPAKKKQTADEVGILSASTIIHNLAIFRERSSRHHHQIRLVETIPNRHSRPPETLSERSYGLKRV